MAPSREKEPPERALVGVVARRSGDGEAEVEETCEEKEEEEEALWASMRRTLSLGPSTPAASPSAATRSKDPASTGDQQPALTPVSRLEREEARLRVRFHIIRNARIENVGKSQSCMVSKLRIIWKQTHPPHEIVATAALAVLAHAHVLQGSQSHSAAKTRCVYR